MSGLFCTCSRVIDTGMIFSAQFGGLIAMGETRTLRLDSQSPVSTTR